MDSPWVFTTEGYSTTLRGFRHEELFGRMAAVLRQEMLKSSLGSREAQGWGHGGGMDQDGSLH